MTGFGFGCRDLGRDNTLETFPLSLFRTILVLLLVSATVVSVLGATLRGLTDPASLTDARERWEMVGLGSTAAACAAAVAGLLLTV